MGNFQLNYTGSQINAWGGRLDALEEQVGNIFDLIYPVGAVYISTTLVDPAALFGGTWEQIEGRFLLASNSTYTAGSVGGEATHTLTVGEMPSHAHRVKAEGSAGSLNYCFVDHKGSTTQYAETFRSLYMENTGGGAAHNNMPPYLSVYMWKRTA